jgi:hypothetical protein
MSDQTRPQLEQAYGYIKEGKRDQARALLEPILSANPDNADAWWLMAMAVTTPTEKLNALQNVLRIKPDHANARRVLDSLETQMPAFGMEEDPFATPGPTASFGTPAPQGSPVASPVPYVAPAGSQIGESDDPFALPPAMTGQPASASGARAGGAGPGQTMPAIRPPAQKSGTNPLVYVLIALIVAVVCICVGCAAIFGGSIAAVINDPTFQTILGTGFTMFEAPDRLPSGAASQGTLSPNQSRTAQLDPLEQHVWRYQGRSGEQITIVVSTQSSTFNPFIGIYDASRRLVSRSAAGRTGRTVTLIAPLPTDGTYSILVGGLGGSFGTYTIRVTSSSSAQ